MKIVVYSCNESIVAELIEFIGLDKEDVVFAASHLQMITALSKNKLRLVILNISSISDLKLIKYINNHNREIKIKLFGDDLLNEMIPIIKESNCEIMKRGN